MADSLHGWGVTSFLDPLPGFDGFKRPATFTGHTPTRVFDGVTLAANPRIIIHPDEQFSAEHRTFALATAKPVKVNHDTDKSTEADAMKCSL